jgi:hypothetical protein
MPPLGTTSRVRFTAVALVLACCACAGSGQFYPCMSDAGDCTARTLPDGGRSDAPFVSEPVLVWHDGQHDASTDLVRFAGALYAAFRHAPAWQADPTAQVFIVRSGDKGRTWKRTAIVSVAGRDLRAPKLTVFKDELWLTATARGDAGVLSSSVGRWTALPSRSRRCSSGTACSSWRGATRSAAGASGRRSGRCSRTSTCCPSSPT